MPTPEMGVIPQENMFGKNMFPIKKGMTPISGVGMIFQQSLQRTHQRHLKYLRDQANLPETRLENFQKQTLLNNLFEIKQQNINKKLFLPQFCITDHSEPSGIVFLKSKSQITSPLHLVFHPVNHEGKENFKEEGLVTLSFPRMCKRLSEMCQALFSEYLQYT